MRYIPAILLLSLLFTISCSDIVEPQKTDDTICYYVYDGDSYACIDNGDSIKVRHLYIDCYETHYGWRLTKQAKRNSITVDSAIKLGRKAKEFVKKLIEGKRIVLVRDRKEDDTDVYGRYLRIVMYNGKRLDSLLLGKGLAFKYKPF